MPLANQKKNVKYISRLQSFSAVSDVDKRLITKSKPIFFRSYTYWSKLVQISLILIYSCHSLIYGWLIKQTSNTTSEIWISCTCTKKLIYIKNYFDSVLSVRESTRNIFLFFICSWFDVNYTDNFFHLSKITD